MTAAALVSCSSDSGGDDCDPTDPLCDDAGPAVVSIEVASPIGTLMAVGRDAQFTASATGPGGDPVTVAFDWTSTDESTATVDGSGRVSAGGAGSTQIRATAGGTTGSLAIQVVDADLAAIERLLEDAFLQSMVSGLDPGTASSLTAILDTCSTSLDSGNVTALQTCLGDALATDGTGGTDAALLAVLSLYFAQADRLLGV